MKGALRVSFRRQLYALAVVVILALITVGATDYTSACTLECSGTVTMTAGELSITPKDVNLSSVILDGGNQVAEATADTNTWTVVDARGSGAGWHVTISSSNFTGGTPLRTIDISEAGSRFSIQLLSANIAEIAGDGLQGSLPTSSVTSLSAIPDTGSGSLTIISVASSKGMGSFSLNPHFELGIPASTYAASYASTVTVDIVTGP